MRGTTNTSTQVTTCSSTQSSWYEVDEHKIVPV